MFLLSSKSLVLKRHLTESWLTPLWTGSWSVKSPSLQTFSPCWRKFWRLVMLIMYIQRGPKPGLSHWQTKNSDKDHKATRVLILASFPPSGACSQTDQGLDQLYRWSERFQTRKLLGLWCPCGDKSKALYIVTDPGLAGWGHPSGVAEAESLHPPSLEQLSRVCRRKTEGMQGRRPGILWSLSGSQRVVWSGLWAGWGIHSLSVTLVQIKWLFEPSSQLHALNCSSWWLMCIKCFEVLRWRAPENMANIASQWPHLNLFEVVS